jgi:hypothetical protein
MKNNLAEGVLPGRVQRTPCPAEAPAVLFALVPLSPLGQAITVALG